jgi:transposase InsO family protein
MPWKVESLMSPRQEFVILASVQDANVSLLCRRFGISRKTGYKWLGRSRQGADADLADRSRRPHHLPGKTEAAVEQLVIELRRQHPAWGARKLKRRLEDKGHAGVPARSTVNSILGRHGLIDPLESAKHAPIRRFERAAPNELWQMDFKSPLVMTAGICHPLTVLDDYSRYNILLKTCEDQQKETVKEALIEAMRKYGMPACMLTDNGPPWGSFGGEAYFTALGVWLIRRGVKLIHGRPLHPQTQGKDERFHRTIDAELLSHRVVADAKHCEQIFASWQFIYNFERPHEALDLAVPATRYTPSKRSFQEVMPPIEYGAQDQVRKVCDKGTIYFKGRQYKVGTAFHGEPVAVRPTEEDGKMNVFYCHQHVAEIDLRVESGDR